MKTGSLMGSALLLARRAALSFIGSLFPQARVVVYCYHSISGEGRFSVTEQALKKQVEYLMAHYKPMTADELAAYVKGEKAVLEPSFVLSFDDGYADLLNIRDYLPSLGIRPIAFVLANPEKVDQSQLAAGKRFLSQQEILSLSQAGWDIGCHSATHPNFSKLDDKQLAAETAGAKQSLEAAGLQIRHFAYPKGKYDARVTKAVQEAGFVSAFSTDNKAIAAGSDLFAIPRVGVMQSHTFSEFKGLGTRIAALIKGVGSRMAAEGIHE